MNTNYPPLWRLCVARMCQCYTPPTQSRNSCIYKTR
uniref:Uncharacterized protein n=1 Tax=Anguilla anguilla TaxID=7936 RepID=A0A0E9TM28_ANGAN